MILTLYCYLNLTFDGKSHVTSLGKHTLVSLSLYNLEACRTRDFTLGRNAKLHLSLQRPLYVVAGSVRGEMSSRCQKQE